MPAHSRSPGRTDYMTPLPSPVPGSLHPPQPPGSDLRPRLWLLFAHPPVRAPPPRAAPPVSPHLPWRSLCSPVRRRTTSEARPSPGSPGPHPVPTHTHAAVPGLSVHPVSSGKRAHRPGPLEHSPRPAARPQPYWVRVSQDTISALGTAPKRPVSKHQRCREAEDREQR